MSEQASGPTAAETARLLLEPDAASFEKKARSPGHRSVEVAAAGNGGTDKVRQYPADAGVYGMLSVGSSDVPGRVASFSNYGSWADIAAPGSGITSFVPGGAYGTWSGTSMTVPFVTGTAALLIARDPVLRPRDVTRRIERSSAALCGDRLRQVDAAAALGNVEQDGDCR